MTAIMKLCIAMMLLLVECKADPEKVVNEGEPFEMTCVTTTDIIFYRYPDPTKFDTSPFTKENSAIGELFTHKFHKAKTVAGDSGWYACGTTEESVKEGSEAIKDTSTWFYLFVKSNDKWFVKKDKDTTEDARKGTDHVFDCRATSPDYTVKFFGPTGEEVTTGDRVTWFPTKGFLVKDIKLDDIGKWKCQITVDSTTQEVTFDVTVSEISR